MENLIINTPEKIDGEIEDFRLESLEDEKNFTAAKIKVCRDPEEQKPIVFYSQELIRNFKDPRDPLGRRQIIKAFAPGSIEAAADTALEQKFKDTILAFKPRVEDYNPLSDIHSQKMNLFMDEDTATFLSDVGVNIDGLGEDFQGIESVSASPFMEEVSCDAAKLKAELRELKGKYSLVKQEMAKELRNSPELIGLTDEEFAERIARDNVSPALVQSYLNLREQISSLESRLGEVSSIVFTETRSRIRLPSILEDKKNELL